MTPSFFGYGSLVNLATHGYPNARSGVAEGWARSWLALEGREYAILSAVPAPGETLQGIIADVPGGDWNALDVREAFYDRHVLPEGTAIYAVPETSFAPKGETRPILLSYLDVVIQGYLAQLGNAGITHFARTTRGWHMPVLNDRAAPIYPRSQKLTDAETCKVDALLRDKGSKVIAP